jgi:hypothetical protein
MEKYDIVDEVRCEQRYAKNIQSGEFLLQSSFPSFSGVDPNTKERLLNSSPRLLRNGIKHYSNHAYSVQKHLSIRNIRKHARNFKLYLS